jgi:electron transfer flavoprotein beta subunit
METGFAVVPVNENYCDARLSSILLENIMNIAVLIKHVVDSTEVRFDKKSGELKLRGLPEKISDYDKHAVEAAVSLKSGIGADVTVFSFGTKAAFKSLKEAVAMGADKGILIAHAQANQLFDPILAAKILANAIQKNGTYDLILCGSMTEDTTNRTIPSGVANVMGYNHIPNVSSITTADNQKVLTSSEIDGIEIKIESECPVVLSVNRKINEPRLATKIQIMKVSMTKVTTQSLQDIGCSEELEQMSGCKFLEYRPITITRKQVLIEKGPMDAVEELLGKLREEGVL